MNCRQAKSDIALWIGDDLPDRARREELRRHVSACSACRKHFKRLKGTLRVLEHADREQTYDASDSVWPELSRRIDVQSQSGGRRARFNGWFPFVAMTAACVALLVTMNPHGTMPVDSVDAPMSRGVLDFPPFGHRPGQTPGTVPPGGSLSPAGASTSVFRTTPSHPSRDTTGDKLAAPPNAF
jgi:hypothetical protein